MLKLRADSRLFVSHAGEKYVIYVNEQTGEEWSVSKYGIYNLGENANGPRCYDVWPTISEEELEYSYPRIFQVFKKHKHILEHCNAKLTVQSN